MSLIPFLQLISVILSSFGLATGVTELISLTALKPSLPQDQQLAAPIVQRFVAHYTSISASCHFLQHFCLILGLVALGIFDSFGICVGLALIFEIAHLGLAFYAAPLVSSISRVAYKEHRPVTVMSNMEQLVVVQLTRVVVCNAPCLLVCSLIFLAPQS